MSLRRATHDLGTVFQAENRNGDALGQYAKALAYDPKMVPAIFNQATVYAVHNAPPAVAKDPTLRSRIPAAVAPDPQRRLPLGLGVETGAGPVRRRP
jgi:hypothetical protein